MHDPLCGVVDWTLANSDGTVLESAVFIPQLVTDPFTLTVHTLESNKAAIYSLELTAQYSGTSVSDQAVFTVDVNNDCENFGSVNIDPISN